MTKEPETIEEELLERLENKSEEVDEEDVEAASHLASELLEQLDQEVVETEADKLAYDFYNYLDYDVDPDNARGTILNNLAASEGLDVVDILEGDGGGALEEVKINEIDEPDQFVTVEVEVSEIWENDTDSLSQVGLVHDDTGRLMFKTWEKSQKPLLTEGESYRLEKVATDEYEGDMQISINSNTEIEMLDEDIEEPDNTEEFTGVIVDLQKGSGLIQRCTVEDCNRVLSDGECKSHGDVEGEFDLRIKGVLDDGHNTQDFILDRELTEMVTGIRMEEAEQMAKDALDTSVVADEMRDEILLNYYTVTGWVSNLDYIIAEDIEETVGLKQGEIDDMVERLTSLETNNTSSQNSTKVNENE